MLYDFDDAPFPRAPSWTQAMGELLHFPRPLRVATPCAGLLSSEDVFRGLGIEHKNFMVYEVDERLKTLLIKRMKDGDHDLDQLHVGRHEGRMELLPLERLETVDLLIAGPGCPPWSLQGKRKGDADEREISYATCVEWVIKLAFMGLMAFALENVLGLHMKKKNEEISYLRKVITMLRKKIPHFEIQFFQLHLEDYQIPVIRNRLVVVGCDRRMCSSGFPRPLARFGQPVRLWDLLNRNLPNVTIDKLNTEKQALYLKQYVAQAVKARDSGKVRCDAKTLCVCDLGRKHNGFGKWLYFDRVPTLTTSNSSLYVFSLADASGPWAQIRVARWIDRSERFVFQGADPSLDKLLLKSVSTSATGNAYPVPMIAAVAKPLLRAMQPFVTTTLPGHGGIQDDGPRVAAMADLGVDETTLGQMLVDALVGADADLEDDSEHESEPPPLVDGDAADEVATDAEDDDTLGEQLRLLAGACGKPTASSSGGSSSAVGGLPPLADDGADFSRRLDKRLSADSMVSVASSDTEEKLAIATSLASWAYDDARRQRDDADLQEALKRSLEDMGADMPVGSPIPDTKRSCLVGAGASSSDGCGIASVQGASSSAASSNAYPEDAVPASSEDTDAASSSDLRRWLVRCAPHS